MGGPKLLLGGRASHYLEYVVDRSRCEASDGCGSHIGSTWVGSLSGGLSKVYFTAKGCHLSLVVLIIFIAGHVLHQLGHLCAFCEVKCLNLRYRVEHGC
jgi:hypothetical protein